MGKLLKLLEPFLSCLYQVPLNKNSFMTIYSVLRWQWFAQVKITFCQRICENDGDGRTDRVLSVVSNFYEFNLLDAFGNKVLIFLFLRNSPYNSYNLQHDKQ